MKMVLDGQLLIFERSLEEWEGHHYLGRSYHHELPLIFNTTLSLFDSLWSSPPISFLPPPTFPCCWIKHPPISSIKFARRVEITAQIWYPSLSPFDCYPRPFTPATFLTRHIDLHATPSKIYGPYLDHITNPYLRLGALYSFSPNHRQPFIQHV